MSDDDDDSSGAPARDSSPLISDKQLKFIGVLQQKVGLSEADMANLVEDLAGKESLEELTRREASELIDELHVQARDKGIDLDAQPLASEKQVGFMRSLKRRAHLTDEEFTRLLEERAGVSDVEQVGKRDASALIDELIKLADAKGGGAKGGGGRGGGGARGGGARGGGARGGGARGGKGGPSRERAAPPPAPAEEPPAAWDGGGYDEGGYDDDVPF